MTTLETVEEVTPEIIAQAEELGYRIGYLNNPPTSLTDPPTTYLLELAIGTLGSLIAAVIVAAFLWAKASLDSERTGEDQLEPFREHVVVGM
jgi:hypothetical protein